MIRNYSLTHHIPFVGRTKELVDITGRLTNPECRLLTLTGLGGSGKTRLAIESTKNVLSHFPDGSVFVGLQPLTRSDLLVSTIAQAVGMTFYGEGELQSQLLDHLREKTLLLILDNFEHLLDGTDLVDQILNYAPGIKVLVTSREALNLREEWLYPLKGMSTPPSVYMYTTALEEYEAIQLFVYHARRIQPNFDLANEQESVIRICIMTAGLPLALELAATWLKGSSTAQIAREIQSKLDFLSTNMRNIEERHRSMRAVFDQSWRLLSETERLVFARLCIFSGSFDVTAAEEIANISFSSLAALVEKSLVQMESSERFSIHELLRQYGVEKLEEYGETYATRARHGHYSAQLMLHHETALKQPQQLETMLAIENDFENIVLAWEWSAQNQQLTNLHAMLNGLYLFGFLRSRYREIIAIFQHTLEQHAFDAPFLGRLLARRWGYLHWWFQEDYQEALVGIEKSLTIAEEQNNPFEIAFCHLMYAYVMNSMQRYADALPHLETSKTQFESINQPYYVCWVLHRLGYVYSSLNNIEKSKDYTEQSLLLARTTHNRVARVICLYNLGSDYILEGDYVKGKQYCAEALHVATEVGHQGQIAHALSLIALCAFFQGDYAVCQDYAERSHTITEAINMLVFQPYSLCLLILLACRREDYAEGFRLNEIGKRHNTNAMGYQLLYWSLATLSCGLGKPREVHDYMQQVIQLSDIDTQLALTMWLVPSMAYTFIETTPEKAVELIAWIFTYPDIALNWVRQWPLFERLQTRLQAMLGNDSYQLHWKKGQTLTLDNIKTTLQTEFGTMPHIENDVSRQQLLTSREIEILHLLAAGMTNPQIASQLVIGTGTVKSHTLSIYRKLDVANRTQAIVRAQELGL